jgi:protein SCO1/2
VNYLVNVRTAMVAASVVLLATVVVSAQGNAPGVRPEPGVPAGQVPGVLGKVSFDQHLNMPLPLDLPFKDEDGQTVKLGDYFGKRPVVVAFVYYECPMLCNQVLNGLASALGVLDESIGKEFDVVTISFDPRETSVEAAGKKKAYLERYKRPSAAQGWHFLTGDEASIRAVTKAAGFNYAWDESTQQFAHASGVIVTTPDGRMAQYFFGIDYSPRDLKFALIESSSGQIGALAEKVLLYCYHYDPSTGQYGFVAMRAVRVGGAVTLLALVGFVVVSLRRDYREAGH